MKFIIIMVICLGIVTIEAKVERDNQKILGISTGYSILTTNQTSKENKNKDIFMGFLIGAQDKKWRTTISADFFSNNQEKYQSYLLKLSNYLLSYLDKKNNLMYKPYMGVNIGYTYLSSKNFKNKGGLSYGGQVGIVLNVAKKVDFDLGYQLMFNKHKDIKSLSNIYLSMNYLY